MFLANGADIGAKTDDGRTALHFAVERYRNEVIKLLLAKGADRKAKTNDGKTALDIAREKGIRR